MTRPRLWRTFALVAFGVVALAACVPVTKTAPPPPPPPAPVVTTVPPPPPNPCASTPAQSTANGTDYVAVTKDDGKLGVHTFHAGSPAERDQQVAQLAQSGQVLSVAPDQTVHAADFPNPDPLDVSQGGSAPQWGVYAANFPTAWGVTKGDGVRIAIVDSGVQADHEDLAGQVVAGKDFVTPGVTDGMSDFYGHGTHVAGIAAAAINGVGGVGGAPNAQIVSARVLNCQGSGALSNVEAGVVWATDPISQGGGGAQVVNLSLGAFSDDPTLDTVITQVEAKGVVVTAAAGNCGIGGSDCLNVPNEPLYPAAAGNVIAVASIDQSLTRSSFSNADNYVTIAAPGGSILSACPSSLPDSKCAVSAFPGYSFKSGTSMATPFVSATAALLTAACPTSTRNQAWVNWVTQRIRSTADPTSALPTNAYGAGILDAGNALTAAPALPAGCPS